MADVITYSTSILPDSITNPLVNASVAKDNTTPFSFLEFITITRIDYSPEEYNEFYIKYLKDWSEAKNKTSQKSTTFVEPYINFLKEIVITYSTRQEQKFLSNLDFNSPTDLDIAIPFFTEKIRQIVLFYKEKRDDLKYTVDKNRQRGTIRSIDKIIFEKIYEYAFSSQEQPNITSIGLSLSSLKDNLKITLEEYVDNYGNYFDIPPVLTPTSPVSYISEALPARTGEILSTSEINKLYNIYNANSDSNIFTPSVKFTNGGIELVNKTQLASLANLSQPPTTTAANNTASVDNNILFGLNAANNVTNANIARSRISGTGIGGTGVSSTGVGVGGTGVGGVGSTGVGGTGASNFNINSIGSDIVQDLRARGDTYSANINPIDPKLYFPDSTYAEVFGSAAFLQDLPLLVNVNLQYDPVCDPNNPIDLIKQNQELRDGVTSSELAELKRKLITKYMGVDFLYIDTTGSTPVSGVLFTAESPWSNIPNLQTPTTPTTPGVFQGDDVGISSFLDINGDAVTVLDNNIINRDDNFNSVNAPVTFTNAVGVNGYDGFNSGTTGGPAGGLGNIGIDSNVSSIGGDTGNLGGIGAGFGGVAGGAGGFGGGGAGGFGNIPGRQRLVESITLLRNVGMFFTPEKTGLFQLNANNYTYSIDFDKLLAQKIYVFPDPAVYGNVSINSQEDYPVVFVLDYRPDVKNASVGVAQGDPLVRSDEQTFTPYFSREQNNRKNITNEMGEYLNFNDLFNQGYITKVRYDIYGNEYALFKDAFGETFREISEITEDRVVSNIIDGHTFYDINEGYDFDYSKAGKNNSTIRTGITARTINDNSDLSFTLSSYPYTLYFREFLPYQNLVQEARNIVGSFKDGGRFTFFDNTGLPDPINSDDTDWPALENYYYAELAEAGLARSNPIDRPVNLVIDAEQGYLNHLLTELGLEIETNQTTADFTVDIKFILSAGVAKNYDCGYFTDELTLNNAYDYGDNFTFYDTVVNESKTVLSPVSAKTGNKNQAVKNNLLGKIYVKNQAFSLATPLSAALLKTFNKYSQNVKAEIYNSPKDFDIIYDTIILETDNYLVFDKISYDEGAFQSPATKNTALRVLSGTHLSKFSNRFFNEVDKTVTFCIVSPFEYEKDYFVRTANLSSEIEITQSEEPLVGYTGMEYLSSGNRKSLIPTIYEYRLKDNSCKKIFPTSINFNLTSLFSLYPVATDDCNLNIVAIKKPHLTFSSYNNTYKISYLGVDNNNLFHVFDYSFIINNQGDVEFKDGKYYQHNKTIRTTDFFTTTTLASLCSIDGNYTINNGRLIL